MRKKTITALIFLFVLATYYHNWAQDRSEYLKIRQNLSQRLDSLELVKQNRKRNGHDIDLLEHQTATLRDSLDSLRQLLEDNKILFQPKQKLQEPSVSTYTYIYKKLITILRKGTTFASTFDWIIVIIAVVVLISTGIFIFGVMRLAIQKRKKPNQRADGVSKKAVNISESQGSNVSADSYYNDIELLRSKIRENNLTEMYNNVNISASQSGEKVSKRDLVSSTEMRELVLEEAQKGLDVSEISKKLHVSEDVVALIIKIEQKRRAQK